MDTEKQTMKISQLIAELEILKEGNGDCEVFMANEHDSCFDGLGVVSIIIEASSDTKTAILIRNKAVLKI